VCFDRKNNRDYLGNGAQYAPEISVDGLADAILKIANNPESISQKSAINKERVQKFDWKNTAKSIAEIYKIIYT